MSRTLSLFSFLLILISSASIAQTDTLQTTHKSFPLRKLTIEPAVGINPMPMSDIVVSNLAQWNVKKRFHVVSRSAVSFNTAFERNFNYVHTDYSYTLSQTIGFGTSVYYKSSSHTFSLMAGVKYDATKETLNNPEFEKVSFALSTVSPDFGLMYNLKLGKKKYFFSYRMYIPLYPYPVKTYDFNAIDSNMANLSLEFGVGIRLK
jgi:hypothetical protein